MNACNPIAKVHQTKQGGSNENAWYGWHKESLTVAWIFMMVSVHDVHNFLARSVCGIQWKINR